MNDQELNLEELEFEDSGNEELSFQEIFEEALRRPFTIEIDTSLVETVKRGVINAKSATRKRTLRRGIQWDAVFLTFEELPSNQEGCTYLTITASRRATVQVKRVVLIDLTKDN